MLKEFQRLLFVQKQRCPTHNHLNKIVKNGYVLTSHPSMYLKKIHYIYSDESLNRTDRRRERDIGARHYLESDMSILE